MDLADIPVTTITGEETSFGALADGRLALVVNVASRCGLTPQYEQLEALQETYGDRGFTVIGFPSNQFLQEGGSEAEIADYCSLTWGDLPDDREGEGQRQARPPALPGTEDHSGHGRQGRPSHLELREVPGQSAW